MRKGREQAWKAGGCSSTQAPFPRGRATPREGLLCAQRCSTHIEAGSRSSHWESQGAFLLDGPEDLQRETDVQDECVQRS